MGKSISDEQIIAAVLESGTLKEAAAKLGITTRTLYSRMNEDDGFRKLYSNARTDVLRSAVSRVNAHISDAVEEIAAIMSDSNTNAAVRLQAAQALLTNAAKLSEELTNAEKTTREIGREPLSFDFSL